MRRLDLALEFKVDPTTITRWEKVGPPRDLLPRLAEVLDVSVNELMGWPKEAA